LDKKTFDVIDACTTMKLNDDFFVSYLKPSSTRVGNVLPFCSL